MGQEISIEYVSNWAELQEAATKVPLYEVNMSLLSGAGGKARLRTESARWYDEFRRASDAVASVAPPALEQQLTTLFLWVDELEEFDAPFSRNLPWYVSGEWEQVAEGLLGAFNPESVANLCDVARAFDWDECERYFEISKHKTLFDFPLFRTYGQSWIDHYEEARTVNAGFYVYAWG